MAESDTIVAPMSPSEASGGVAPRTDASSLIDPECCWVVQRASGWQLGEQGVIEAIVERLEPHIPPEERWAVEFGAGDNCSAPLTCKNILNRDGWRGLLIEPVRPWAMLVRRSVPESTVVIHGKVMLEGERRIDEHLKTVQAPANPALMIVDVDSFDYYIVDGMEARPAILCVETLDRLAPTETDGVPYIPSVEECGRVLETDFAEALQANGAAFDVLMGGRGYILAFRTRYNSIYVRSDMVPHLRKKCLNLGAGDRNFPGYEVIDLRVNGKDIKKLDYPDNSVDEIYCAHSLEHLDCIEGQLAIHEWTRVLKPGGVLKVAVPDLRKVAEQIAKADPETDLAYMTAVLYGSQNYAENHHKWGYTEETLRQTMNSAGLGAVRTFKPFLEDCSTNPLSLNLEGTKRWWPKVEKFRLAIVLSQPRFTFSGHELALMEITKKLTERGIEVHFQPAVGAFWDRDMTIGTRVAIETHDPDALLYSDYDSLPIADDILKLIDTLNGSPTMAAIGAVQMSRHDDKPLLFDAQDQRVNLDAPICRVPFQHFGLTLIRREVFDEMPQPWFWSVPGKNAKGEWDWEAWGRTDADITFWRNMHLLGFQVYQHNEVCIGHMIVSVKWPRDAGKGVQLQPIENYYKRGKPKDAVFKPEVYRAKPKVDPSQNGHKEGTH